MQLRPVRPSPGPEVAPSCGQGLRRELTPAAPQDRGKPSASPKSRNSTREMQRDSPPACAPGARPTPAGSPGGGRGDAGDPGAGPGTSPSRKPPPIAKKPKLVLVVPPPQRQLPAPGPRGEAGGCAAGAGLEGTRSRCSELEGGATGSVSPRTLDTDVPAVQPDAWRATEQEQPEGQEESRVEDGAHGAGSGPAPQDSRRECPSLSAPAGGTRVPEGQQCVGFLCVSHLGYRLHFMRFFNTPALRVASREADSRGVWWSAAGGVLNSAEPSPQRAAEKWHSREKGALESRP